MSKTTDYMDEVKRRKGLTSNYQLHKALDVSEQAISECYAGRKHADLYIGTRIALALGIEPIHLLAEVREEVEKNEKKRQFWASFRTRAAVALISAGALMLGYGYQSEANASTASTTGKSERLYLSTNYARRRSALGRWLSRCFDAWNFGALAPA